MKKTMIIFALAACTVSFAQNTNEIEVETTKKTMVTDNDGVEVNTKKVEMKTKTELALGNKTSNQNFTTLMKPTKVVTDVDYSNNGKNYRFMPKKDGYYMVDANKKDVEVARLYPTSQKGYYIYTKDGNSSIGYFNTNGDFMVESYNPENDSVMNYVYKIKMDDATKMKKKKDKMKKQKMKKDKMK